MRVEAPRDNTSVQSVGTIVAGQTRAVDSIGVVQVFGGYKNIMSLR
jgi:hypothetical protein